MALGPGWSSVGVAVPEWGRGGRRYLAAALATLLLTAGCASGGHGGRAPHPPSVAGSTTASAPATLTMPPSQPTRIEIPAIGVRAPVDRVGLSAQGTIEVPPLERAGETGWYEYGPTPGELGPAVVLGHVDSAAGPAVFFRLAQLKPGDTIEIARADGRVAVFRTVSTEKVPKTAFPTDRVYGNLDYAGLRLVTCGGTFDKSRGSYTSNVIVYATLTDTRSP